MISEAQRNAARLNGAKSRGPVTPEGKKTSSMNALRHGVFARSVVIGNESVEAFEKMHQAYLAAFNPRNDVERDVVEEMVAAKWRAWRTLNVEDEWLEQELDERPDEEERARIAGAFGTLDGKSRVSLLSGYEARMDRKYHRAVRALQLLRKMREEPADENKKRAERTQEVIETNQ